MTTFFLVVYILGSGVSTGYPVFRMYETEQLACAKAADQTFSKVYQGTVPRNRFQDILLKEGSGGE